MSGPLIYLISGFPRFFWLIFFLQDGSYNSHDFLLTLPTIIAHHLIIKISGSDFTPLSPPAPHKKSSRDSPPDTTQYDKPLQAN
ncbi:MAG: hypothetical protein EA362_14080, partial [Saprospirales bacterium]